MLAGILRNDVYIGKMVGRYQMQQFTLAALAVAAVAVCLIIVQPFIWAIISAAALAVLFYPLYIYVLRRMPNRPSMAAALTLLILIVVVLVPAAWIITTMANEAAQTYVAIKNRTEADGGWVEWITHMGSIPLVRFGIEEEAARQQIRDFMIERAETISGILLRAVRGVLSNVAGFLFQSVITLFIFFFLLRDGDRLLDNARAFLPLDDAVFDRLIEEVGQSVLANVYGVGAVAVAQGTLTGLLFWGVGVHSPVLWGVIAGFCSMIPVIGPPIVWLPVAISLGVTGSWGKAAIVAAFGAGVIGTADNIIRPWIISGRVQLHPLLVFLSLLGGAQAFGFLGLFIGPAVLSVTIVIFEILKWGIPGSKQSVALEEQPAVWGGEIGH